MGNFMLDAFDREINYIRISVTDRCNLHCSYCMPAEGIQICAHDEILNYEEIIELVRIFVTLGIHQIKLTGGEPFIRRGFLELAQTIKKVPGVEKLTVTTNGTYLKGKVLEQALSCFDGINVSLDTLEREVYQEITGIDAFKDAYDGLQQLLLQNSKRKKAVSVKLNCVLTEKNRMDIVKLAGLAKEQKLLVRFIELMPIGLGKGQVSVGEAEAKKLIEKAYGALIPDSQIEGNGPAVYYRIDGFLGKIGFISALSHKFCSTCNRVRLTADGYLKTCLQYDTGVDLKKLLRSGASEEEIKKMIVQAIMEKPAGHAFGEKQIQQEENRCMSEIGG